MTTLLAGMLCIMVALESTIIKWVGKNQKAKIPSEQLVVLVEIVKFLVSLILYAKSRNKRIFTFAQAAIPQADNVNENENENHNGERELLIPPRNENIGNGNGNGNGNVPHSSSSSIFRFLFPAALYAVSNNVTFYALHEMTPAMFNLLMNMKIPLTGLFAWSFLGYRITFPLFMSFALLFAGSAIASIKYQEGSLALDGTMQGFLFMIVYTCCSAGGGVYIEYVTKMLYPFENIYVQNLKFCTCSIIVNALAIILRGKFPFEHLEPIHMLSVLALAANGLLTAAVLKYGGSILKTYAVSVAMFFSAAFTFFVFHVTLGWNFYVGALLSALSVNIYARLRNT